MATSGSIERSAQNGAVSETVVSAVAELTDSDPLSLEPLYGVVDPDALDALFPAGPAGPARSPNRITFTYCGCDVVVADGVVRVSGPERETATDEGCVTDGVRS